MKLKCEISPLRNGKLGHSLAFNDGDREHDAAAAHALMQAMREAGDGSADVAFYSDDDYQRWIYDRANELLREWGFDSGELHGDE